MEAFQACHAMRKFQSCKLRKIGENSFYGCVSLVEIDLENVTEISKNSFAYCQSIVTHKYPLLKKLNNAYQANSALIQIIGD
jgi:hypothetical protein